MHIEIILKKILENWLRFIFVELFYIEAKSIFFICLYLSLASRRNYCMNFNVTKDDLYPQYEEAGYILSRKIVRLPRRHYLSNV